MSTQIAIKTASSVQDLTRLKLQGLCEETKKGTTVGYLQVRLTEILKNSRYSGLLKPVALQEMDTVRMVRFIYSCFLVVSGLKTERGIKRVGKYLFELEEEKN
jgi:hypothetical protein